MAYSHISKVADLFAARPLHATYASNVQRKLHLTLDSFRRPRTHINLRSKTTVLKKSPEHCSKPAKHDI